MHFFVKATLLLIFISSNAKSNEIKGTMEITVLVTLSTLPFAKDDYVISGLAQLIQKFIFGNMPEKIAANMEDHGNQELTIPGSLRIRFQNIDETKSDNQQTNIVYGSQFFSSGNNYRALTSTEASASSTVTLLEEQSLPNVAATAVNTNTLTLHFNIPFIACFNDVGEPCIGIKTSFEKIYGELQKQLTDHIE